ncbi:hypothetical protein ABPG75_009840 [Micractinium tetrahymenae]
MRVPRPWALWAAAVAVLLQAAVASASCTAEYLKFDLLSTAGTGCASSPQALCLQSYRVDVDTDCNVTVTPLSAAGNYVPGIFSTNAASTYALPMACPTAASPPVQTAQPQASSDVRAAIELALERHIYGSQYELAMTTAWDSGTFTMTTAAGCTLKYAITQVSNPTAALLEIWPEAVQVVCQLVGGILSLGSECQLNLGDSCPGGTQPVTISTGKVCALCPGGSFSTSGGSCNACSAGKYAGGVGATACANCTAGSYASSTGRSTCQPCAAGTYQSYQGKQSCNPCPASSYARLPGATQCVRCVAGVALCFAGTDAGCNPSMADAPSAGYKVLSVTTPGTLPASSCAMPAGLSFANPALFGQCTLSPTVPTKLTVYVDDTCGVQIYPIGDTACAEPAASYWSSMPIKGHYVAPDRIATSLGSASSSYLMSLTPVSGTSVTLSYWAATTNLSNAAAVSESSKVCSGTADVIGGQVIGLPASPATCPAGSYNDGDVVDGCRPCPVGTVCAANSTTPTSCADDQYQPYLGQSADACLTCDASAVPRYTSNAGDSYCTVTWVNTTCDDGQEFDEDTQTCGTCPAGTLRMAGRDAVCMPCEPGYYSPAGATNCTLCPLNQFSPVYGLAQRSNGVQKCLYCPVGSVAKTDGGSVGLQGSTCCDPCQPGTVSAVVAPNAYATCNACQDGFYRSGDASLNNNICKPIPAGWKEKARNSTSYDRSQLELCGKGEVSYWADSNTRMPADAESCQPCLGDNTYAPRMGMSKCQPCQAGSFPDKSVGTLSGNDICSPCSGNTYRPASSSSPTCLVCTAGREVDSSDNTNCLPCLAGYYMTDINGGNNTSLAAVGSSCVPCEVNTYQPMTGQTRCVQCPAGWSTQDEGNTECQPCPIGYYSSRAAEACIPAPAGTYVEDVGARTYTQCPTGTCSSEEGSDSCSPCPPGQYASTLGSKSCKTCPAGTFSKGRASTCQSCMPGYYSSPGSSTCSACKAGTFANASRSASCMRCPLGSQCPTIAARLPQLCPRGFFSNSEGSRLCAPCPANTYQNTPGQRGCTVCPRGYNTRGLTGQSSCQPMRAASRRMMPQ